MKINLSGVIAMSAFVGGESNVSHNSSSFVCIQKCMLAKKCQLLLYSNMHLRRGKE